MRYFLLANIENNFQRFVDIAFKIVRILVLFIRAKSVNANIRKMLYRILVQCLLTSFVYSLSQHPILIVISYDAFRYNFFSPQLTPNLERLKQAGTHADFLFNVFPTKTFPNHHSIATGLYPETHGVVGNKFFDVTTGKVVGMSPELYAYNNGVIPIWVEN